MRLYHLIVLAWVLALSACAPSQLLVQGLADALASQSSAPEDDLVLAREASAFYLKMSESVLRQTPEHLALTQALTSGFTQYAYAFVQLEADRLDPTDAKAAQRLRERAAHLYQRAKNHALTALEKDSPGFMHRLSHPQATPALVLRPDQVGVAYWGAAAWGGAIALSTHQPDTVADLPLARRLAALAWQADPAFGQGALASLMGRFELSSPGGTPASATPYFDQAIALGAERNAGVWLAKAEALALPAGDRASFEALLQQAIQVSQRHPDLSNNVMRERAQWLLDQADDLF